MLIKPTTILRSSAAAIHIPLTARTRATNLLHRIQYTHPPNCPCHGNPSHPHHKQSASSALNLLNYASSSSPSFRSYATPSHSPSLRQEYAFEMASSTVRFGPGSTSEVGMDFVNLGFTRPKSPGSIGQQKKLLIITDPIVAELPVMKTVLESLDTNGILFEVYKDVHVEPKDYSVKVAIEFGKKVNADGYLAVGGGSVMDTAKMVNLYGCYPEAELLDFVNAPIGKGLPIDKPLKPLICIPTTAGTGSETTGTAIFDITSSSTKTGISHRNLKPTLGIIDPLNHSTLPSTISIASGLDVLFHSLESLTAIPYSSRYLPSTSGGGVINPLHRPAYQGSNPISDIFSLASLKMCISSLPSLSAPASSTSKTYIPNNPASRNTMSLAATLAGVGFGNAGVHLCHGMSYPISGLNPSKYIHPSYPDSTPLIPHGVSVAVTAPAVFKFTSASSPERHLAAVEAFGVDISGKSGKGIRNEDVGDVLSDAIKGFLEKLGDQPRGLKGLGFTRGDVKSLVDGTVPQRRVVQLAPGLTGEGRVALVEERGEVGRHREELARLFEDAMEW